MKINVNVKCQSLGDISAKSADARPYRAATFQLVMMSGLLLTLGGCAEPSPAPTPSNAEPPAVTPGEMNSAGVSPRTESPAMAGSSSLNPANETVIPEASSAVAPPPTGAAAAQSAEPGVERVTADVGVGQRGRALDQYQGGVQRMIVQPARTLFAVRERLVFSTQIPQAMELYKAGNNERGPASHEDFMRDIVQFNNIRLPDLPPGQRYIYDPDSEELLVERPAP